MEAKKLINLLRSADREYVESQVTESDYRLALHDLYITKDPEGVSELVEALAKYDYVDFIQDLDGHVPSIKSKRGNSIYEGVLDSTRNKVLSFAEDSDSLFSTGDSIESFVKEGINRNIVNTFLDKHDFHEPCDYFKKYPIQDF